MTPSPRSRRASRPIACALRKAAAAQRRRSSSCMATATFLIGRWPSRSRGLQLLDDPTVLVFAGQRWLLSHGDALCLADHRLPWQFRAQVRTPQWQERFLAQPLAAAPGRSPGPARRAARRTQAAGQRLCRPGCAEPHAALAHCSAGGYADPWPHAPARGPRPGPWPAAHRAQRLGRAAHHPRLQVLRGWTPTRGVHHPPAAWLLA
jgi:UDP-2,3-diacylglucosamine hydrolase